MSGEILEDAWSFRFANVVGWYAKRLIGKNFHAMRVLAGQRDAVSALTAEPGPIMIVMNHSSWWDPMLVLALRRMFFPERSFLIPMDRVSLERFRFLRKCGLFGLDPDDPGSLAAMGDYVRRRMHELPRCTIGLTPQGRFVDVREPVRPRPGAAAILARSPSMRLWSVASEYGFWQEQKPEIFFSVVEVERPENGSTAGWQRQLAESMEANQRRLQEAVKTRDPLRFETLLGGRVSGNHPVYDFWLRLRGKTPGIETGHRSLPSNSPR
ncbi:MAG: lysophospholipid acyltransferase family protein [Planctomycetes bacterium]|nr:lysophospholipid acyltransferase family protein [Planctomycetota bacterium]